MSWKRDCFQSNLTLPLHNLRDRSGESRESKKLDRSLVGVGEEAKTHRRVPRMTSSMDPAALDWLRLGTSGRRVRGGGFLRLADCAGRDSDEELCSRVRRGRGLLEGTTLEPGLWHGRSSGSLYGKVHNRWMMHFHLLPAGWTLCQTMCKDQGQKHGTGRCPSFGRKCLPLNGEQELQDIYSFPFKEQNQVWNIQVCDVSLISILFINLAPKLIGWKSKMCPYWFLSSTPRFLCWRGMLWITMRSFRLCCVAAAPTGTLPAWGTVCGEGEKAGDRGKVGEEMVKRAGTERDKRNNKTGKAG